MPTTYAIDDADGNQITTGLQGLGLATAAAKRIATDLGQTVYLYEVVAAIDPDAQCAEHGCAMHSCADEHQQDSIEIDPAE